MDKKAYILHQFRRTWNKKYENYCIERIYNKLDNPNLIFVTQQLFRRKSGIALADLYFPQLRLTVEIDEEFHKNQTEKDAARTREILENMRMLESIVEFEPQEIRIDAGDAQTLESLNAQIDCAVACIQEKILALPTPLVWSSVRKSVAEIRAEKVLRADGTVALHSVWEVSELFAKGYKRGAQRCYFPISATDFFVWCPKLKLKGIKNSIPYINEITVDGDTIYESKIYENDDFVCAALRPDAVQEKRLVFPYYKTETGEMAYVFKGIYALDAAESRRLQKGFGADTAAKRRFVRLGYSCGEIKKAVRLRADCAGRYSLSALEILPEKCLDFIKGNFVRSVI